MIFIQLSADRTKSWFSNWVHHHQTLEICIFHLIFHKRVGNSSKHVCGNNICPTGEAHHTTWLASLLWLLYLFCLEYCSGRKERKC